MFVTSNAIDGLKYYLLPDFSKFNFTVFSQSATQVLFSVGIGNIIVSLRFGLLSNIKLPWLDASGISHLGLYDWLNTFSGYIPLPLGCLLVCFFVAKVWGFKEYKKELTNDGKFGRVTLYDKILTCIVVPIFMIIIILNVFGFIR